MQLIETTIGKILLNNSLHLQEREAAVYMDGSPVALDKPYRMTWHELQHRVNAVAKGLLSLGIRRGDHVAIWATNIPEWLLTQLAANRIGAVLVTINPEWRLAEVEYVLKQSDARALVMIRGFEKQSRNKVHRYDYMGIMNVLCPELEEQHEDQQLYLERLPELRRIVLVSSERAPGMLRWQEMLEMGDRVSDEQLEKATKDVKAHDPAMIQYTSGTTGFPKGAVLTHYNIINNARVVAHNQRLTSNDRLCGPVPYYHCFGSILFSLGCLVSGAAMIIPAPTFDAHKTLEAIEAEKATVLYGVPTMFLTELDDLDFDAFDLSSLRTGIMAGAPVDKELFEAVTQKIGAREMTIAYGLTEASPVTHQTLIDDPLEKRMTTVGRPIPYTESKIVNPETLKEVAPGEVGEIWVRGFNVMRGYYKKSEDTRDALIDGWLRTGDLGVVDEEGYFRIVGRLKEMFITGGHNVYPAEVEQQLHTILEDKVEMLQVVGVPHPTLQEVGALAVQCKPGEKITLDEVRARCEGRLEWPKIPRHLLVLKDFSEVMTVTGKIQKFKLKELFEKQLHEV